MADAWPDWSNYVQSLTLDPNQFPRLRQRAQVAANLQYQPQYQELARQQASAKDLYGWNTAQLEPQYQRYANEQQYGLANTMASNQLAQGQAEQAYGTGAQNLGNTFQTQAQRLEQDMARRGLWNSGLLSKQNTMLGNTFQQNMGNLNLQRTARLGQLYSQGEAAQNKAQFNLSDAQRNRVAQMQRLNDVYNNTVGGLNLKRQQLGTQQGQTAEQQYNNFMDQYRDFALKARQQGLAEQTYQSAQYWNKTKFDEMVRQYNEAQAKKASSSGGGGYGSSGGYSSSGGGGGGGTTSTGYTDAQNIAFNNQSYQQLLDLIFHRVDQG